jgi:hypothetical protein
MPRGRTSGAKTRRRLSSEGKEMLRLTKIWFHSGGAIKALAMAAGEMNKYQAEDIADFGKKAITRGNNRIRPANEVLPSGQYRKSTRPDKPGRPPRRYKPFSFHVHAYAYDKGEKISVKNKGLGNSMTFHVPGYIAGPVRYGENPKQPRINGRTAMYHQKGKTTQQRWFRMVPAIPSVGGAMKPTRWDGASWREEYSHKRIEAPVAVKEAWWQAMHRFGMAPEEPWFDDMSPTYDFAWKKVSVKVSPNRNWMTLVEKNQKKKSSRHLDRARDNFPRFAKLFIKMHHPTGKFKV